MHNLENADMFSCSGETLKSSGENKEAFKKTLKFWKSIKRASHLNAVNI